jgi:hypothetical protein
MKKLVVAFASVFAVAALAAGVASGSGGGGTVTFSGFPCGVFDGNGQIFITTDSQTILYQNQQSSKAVLKCSGWGAPAASFTILSGFGCNTQYGSTTNTTDKIGKNGNSQLVCTVDLTNADVAASSGSMGAAG